MHCYDDAFSEVKNMCKLMYIFFLSGFFEETFKTVFPRL